MQVGFDFGDNLSDAIISDDEKYRYMLSRRWSLGGKTVAFICLNPSTADGNLDDPTVRRCVGFAKKWGGSRLLIGNLFAYRSTDPSTLKIVADPKGHMNDEWLERIAAQSDIVIAAWGGHGDLHGRDAEVREQFNGRLHALRLTKHGSPAHPLYLPAHLEPFPL